MIKIRIFHDLIVPNLAHAKGLSRVHQNIIGYVTFYVGPECLLPFFFFLGTFPFSMTFDIFKDFHDFSRPGNQSFKFHDFSRFSMTARTLI